MGEIYNYLNISFVIGAIAFGLTGVIVGYIIGVDRTEKMYRRALFSVKKDMSDNSNIK